jgi:hypothetical protein
VKKAKQTELPGVERETIPELDAALELYVEKRDARVAALVEEKAAKAKLLEVARTHGKTIYRDETAQPPLVLTLTERDAVLKVTAVGDGSEAEEDEGEELDA